MANTALEAEGFLKRHGAHLIDLGYPIVPIKPGEKHPGFKGWSTIKATHAHHKRWVSNGFAEGGVGVLSCHYPAGDLDVKDPEVVAQLVAWCDAHIGPTVQRVGEAPKTLLAFRTDEPFAVIRSKKYRDFLGLTHKVEVLGDGQQYVAYAIHPGTGKPYEWVTEKSLLDVAPHELPLITVETAQALVDYFESIAPDDWEVVERGNTGALAGLTLTEDERLWLHAKPKFDITSEKLKTAVNMLDPNMGRGPWVAVGMGLFHQFDGSIDGFAIWDDWSSQGDTYNATEMERCWASFATDFRKEPVTAATIFHMAKQVYKAKKAKERTEKGFSLTHGRDVRARLSPVAWLIENYIEANTTGLMYGDPGSYKSFLALAMALHCALGLEWQGNPVKKGLVVYVAGEGHGGLARRLAAFEKAFEVSIDDAPIYFSEQAASLYDEASALSVVEAIDAVADIEDEAPVMVVIDTLARNLGAGDENSTADMNVFIDNVDQLIRAKYECSVMIVHHTGHSNKNRARGASTIRGAIDFEYQVEKPDDGSTGYYAKLVSTKMKDAPEPAETWFEGESVTVAEFDGKEVTSLVFRQAIAPVEVEPALTGKQLQCYHLLRDCGEQGVGVERMAFQQMLLDAQIPKSANAARMLVNAMMKKGHIIEFEGFLYADNVKTS